MLIECVKVEVKALLLANLYASDHIEQVYFSAQGRAGKVGGPNSVTHLKRTPIVEWCVWCGSKNGHQKYMSGEEIGLHAQH